MAMIDLNSNLGEWFGPWTMGDDATMLSVAPSANIACGGHAGDPETMYRTLQLAKENGVNVGAHVGAKTMGGLFLAGKAHAAQCAFKVFTLIRRCT